MRRGAFLTRFFYVRMHVPTRAAHEESIVCASREEFLERLAGWNGSCPSTWAYWISPHPRCPEPLTKQEEAKYARPWPGAPYMKT